MLLLENEIICWNWTQLNAVRAQEMPKRKVPEASTSEPQPPKCNRICILIRMVPRCNISKAQ
jgi:hypothetical protein